jgi:D-arabinose 1-dehydrogenase-like Zn-dependent alcohol dehydrogenase
MFKLFFVSLMIPLAAADCHSDVLTKEGSWPGIQYPRVPGHE